MTTLAYIGLGSNLGDSARTLLSAWREIDTLPKVRTRRLSSPYRSTPQDMESENLFVNAVGCVETSLTPTELLIALLDIEARHGRIRVQGATGYTDRTLDLDLLLHGTTLSTDPQLTLPHPEMQNRLFVLAPLAEIAPQCIHPPTGKTALQLLEELRNRETGHEIMRISWPKK